jgi:acetyl esterase/lipase
MPLLTADDYQQFPTVACDHRIAYGSHPLQFGELTLPDTMPPHPIIILIHGGGYRAMYDLRPLGSVVAALAAAGFAVWNIEYHRFGNGGEFPTMFLDVGAASDYLRQIAEAYRHDLTRVISIGHSAGGHLALWLAGRPNIENKSPLYVDCPLLVHGVLALAPLADVQGGAKGELSSDALLAVMGGEPNDAPGAYRNGCPTALLPFGRPQVIIVGSEDKSMLANAKQYAERAKQSGDDIQLIELPDAGHFEIVSVDSKEWNDVRQALVQLGKRLR